eukprot:3123677-Rhodomonas_salina.1
MCGAGSGWPRLECAGVVSGRESVRVEHVRGGEQAAGRAAAPLARSTTDRALQPSLPDRISLLRSRCSFSLCAVSELP